MVRHRNNNNSVSSPIPQAQFIYRSVRVDVLEQLVQLQVDVLAQETKRANILREDALGVDILKVGILIMK